MVREFVATIGFFDGVHIGHQRLIQYVTTYSLLNSIDSLAVTFDTTAKIKKNLIYPLETKIETIKSLGIKNVKILKFLQIQRLSPKQFFENIIVALNIKTIFVGEDFKFGYCAKGDVNTLKKLCKKYNIKLLVIKNVCVKINNNDCKVSSSLIRKLISNSEFDKVELLLGREYFVTGEIFHGKGMGKLLGFPTVNFYPQEDILLPNGIIAGESLIYTSEGKKFKKKSVANFGYNPTIDSYNKIVCEVHVIDEVIDYKIDKIFFRPLKKLRDEKKFESVKLMLKNINKDVISAKKFFSTRS